MMRRRVLFRKTRNISPCSVALSLDNVVKVTDWFAFFCELTAFRFFHVVPLLLVGK